MEALNERGLDERHVVLVARGRGNLQGWARDSRGAVNGHPALQELELAVLAAQRRLP